MLRPLRWSAILLWVASDVWSDFSPHVRRSIDVGLVVFVMWTWLAEVAVPWIAVRARAGTAYLGLFAALLYLRIRGANSAEITLLLLILAVCVALRRSTQTMPATQTVGTA